MIRPEEVLAKLDAADMVEFDRLEAVVDARIKEQFDGSNAVSVDLLMGKRADYRLRPALKARLAAAYRAGGWTVHFDEGSCQREGDWCNMTLRGKA